MEELFPHGGVVAIAYRRDHVAAVVAEVFDRPPRGHVPLVVTESGEDHEQDADDCADDPAREA